MDRLVAHVDMDCFFAAVEVLDNPSLAGRPVIVGADPEGGRGRGVVAAASYQARGYGIHSAMPISLAYRLCPQGVYLPGRMERYAEMSSLIMEILRGFTPLVEQVSVDEAFLDLSGCRRLWGDQASVGRRIKAEVKAGTGLTASVGLASNKLTAKVASDLGKPDGLLVVPAGREREFLAPLPVGKLWGAGPRTVESLKMIGIVTIGQLAECDSGLLSRRLGAMGICLNRRANGIDDRSVSHGDEVKSVGREHTYRQDTNDRDRLLKDLLRLSDRVASALRAVGLRGRTVTLKLRYQDFETHTFSHTSSQASNNASDIYRETGILLETRWQSFRKVRLIGVSVSNLDRSDGQLGMFGEGEMNCRRAKLAQAVDSIREKHGRDAVKLAGEL